MDTARINPFMDHGQWFWRTETQQINGPYLTQVDALAALLRHCNPRGRWQRLGDALKEFIHS